MYSLSRDHIPSLPRAISPRQVPVTSIRLAHALAAPNTLQVSVEWKSVSILRLQNAIKGIPISFLLGSDRKHLDLLW